jgi:site-specific recombinase XerC
LQWPYFNRIFQHDKALAAALGHASLEQCPADAACRQEATWATALEDHWRTLETQGRTISAYTRRNVRNDIRKVFKLAEASGLLQASLPERLLPVRPNLMAFRRQQLETNPYPETYRYHGVAYTLPQTAWPPAIAQAWQEYRTRCGVRIRETSFASYLIQMRMYLGYFVNVQGLTPTLDDLFAVAQLAAFVRWHAARMGRTLSVQGRQTAIMIATMAKVLEHPAQHTLADFRRSLKVPTPVHNKRNHWVSLATLEAVAEACLAEGRAPLVPAGRASRFPGAQRAGRFQRGLILKLLIRVPLRQRNIREMQLGKHLAKDPQTGHWHLAFRGDELKVGNRGAAVNKYEVNLTTYCPEWLPLLDEFLQVHRPKLPNAATSRFLFLGQHGIPYSTKTLHMDLSEVVAMRTGQRFYPHLIRTIWATEYLDKTQDFATAATMLGDTLGTVMKTYYDVIHRDQHAKAKAFLGTALHTG